VPAYDGVSEVSSSRSKPAIGPPSGPNIDVEPTLGELLEAAKARAFYQSPLWEGRSPASKERWERAARNFIAAIRKAEGR
jgi:hypothetical protein